MVQSGAGDQLSGSGRSRPLSDLAAFVMVSGAVLLTRIPFLPTSTFGYDPDAWRVALAARHLATAGEYMASRFPAYPVHEIGSALVWFGGPVGLNGLTALFSGIAAGFAGLILRRLGVRAYALGALAFALTPVVFINSLVAMDYVWSIAFVLGALYFALREYAGAAGVLLGLAVGTRLTAGAMLMPLGWILWRGGAGAPHRVARLVGTAALVSGVCYVWPLITYGPDFLRFYDGRPPLRIALHGATSEVWGVVGVFAVAAAVVFALVRGERVAKRYRRVEQALLAGIALYGLAYVRLPLEAGYLVPMVPLVLFWLALRLPHRGFDALCLALVVSPFMLDLEADSSLPPEQAASGLPIRIGEARMRLLPLGPLFTERARMSHETEVLRHLAESVDEVPRPALVLAGGYWSKLTLTLGGAADGLVIVDSLGALGAARSADPLARIWPPVDSTRRLPIYVLHGAEQPPSDDPRLLGRTPRILSIHVER